MSGSILIVDALATNRIMLKVRLGRRFYSVSQAGSGAGARDAVVQETPDIVLVTLPLPDMDLATLQRELANAAPAHPPAIVALLAPCDRASHDRQRTCTEREARIGALRAGAAMVLPADCADSDLQARLRALLRQRHQDSDLRLQTDTAEALGFAEEPAGFARRGRISIMASDRAAAAMLSQRIGAHCRHSLSIGVTGQATGKSNEKTADEIAGAGPDRPVDPEPDVILLHVGARSAEADMATLAALRAAPRNRRARLIAVVDRERAHLCGRLLDMGAHDAMSTACDAREMALRTEMQLAQKCQNDALRSRVQTGLRAAVTDPLTGLYNRRYALNFLDRALKNDLREGGTLAIMLADLDHFKQVNDHHGHATGDAVLSRVSEVMRHAVPGDGMLARIGGEEFLVVLPGATAESAAELANALRRGVRGAHVPLADGAGRIGVTISIGVTLLSRRPGEEWPSAERLIGEADRALYDSKSCGRDKVTVSMLTAA